MTAITDALTELKNVVKTVSVTNGPGDRVWVHPGDSASVSKEQYPFVIISKMNSEPGQWRTQSFGSGMHIWDAVIAVYLAPGPVVVTNVDANTVAALTNSDEWYKAMSDVLYANMKLNGTVEFIGDPETDELYQYITDNLMWDSQQHYGHLFLLTIYQHVNQATSA